MREALRVLIAVVVMATVYGACFLVDVHPERGTSWPIYLGLAFAAGLVGVGGEFASGAISGPDKTTDPLPKRAGRLFFLLVSAALFAGLLYAISSVM